MTALRHMLAAPQSDIDLKNDLNCSFDHPQDINISTSKSTIIDRFLAFFSGESNPKIMEAENTTNKLEAITSTNIPLTATPDQVTPQTIKERLILNRTATNSSIAQGTDAEEIDETNQTQHL